MLAEHRTLDRLDANTSLHFHSPVGIFSTLLYSPGGFFRCKASFFFFFSSIIAFSVVNRALCRTEIIAHLSAVATVMKPAVELVPARLEAYKSILCF